MFVGGHFGSNLSTPTPPSWQKLYGPSLLFVDTGTDAQVVAGAAAQAAIERAAWPYCWLKNAANQASRSTVDGTIAVSANRSAAGVMVTLADPTELYSQGNGYIYWSQADADGRFVIKNVRPGTYAVHVYATRGDITSSVATAASTTVSPTDAGTMLADASATVAVAQDNTEIVESGVAVAAGATHLGTLTWSPVVHPNELWVIGTSDRTSGEFLVSGTTIGSAALREYGPSATLGLWDIPPANLTYTIGTSTPAQGWYFAQSKVGIWNVDFGLAAAVAGNAYLTIAIAGVSQNPQLSVSINGHAVFNQTFGNDGTLYRSALTSGRYQLVRVTFPGSYLVVGAAPATNTLAFDMTSAGSGSGIMYDLIKLETD
jgi:rhamnogalacturonan endolyase